MKRRSFLAQTLGAAVACYGQTTPEEIYTIPFDGNRAAEMVLAQCLQGLAGRETVRIWLDRRDSMSAVILAGLEREGVPLRRLSSVWELPDRFWQALPGYILYRLNEPGLNVAVSVAGLRDAVAADESIEARLKDMGLPMIWNAAGKSDQDCWDEFGNEFARGIAVEQAISKPAYLRDWAVMNRAFTFWADANREFRRNVLAKLGPGATAYGWGPDEYKWIADLSSSGGGGFAADWCVNLSGMSKLPATMPEAPQRQPPEPAREGERIVAFVLSDGDNIQWLTGNMPLHSRYFASKLRGSFNMNWEVSPALGVLAPRVLRYFYENATPQDAFVAAGTPTYRYIHLEPEPKGAVDAEQVQAHLRAAGLRIVSVINDNGGSLEQTRPLLELPEVDAVVYKRYSPYEGLHGQMLWHNGKPAVSYKFVLWENHKGGSVEEVANSVAQMPSSPAADPASYALVNVHAWSFAAIGGPLEAVRRTIELLPAGTRVVLIDEFFKLLTAGSLRPE